MNAIPPSNSPIIAAFAARTPGSAAAYAEAREHFPGGVTHDVRYVRPHPLAVTRAAGPRKWDVDGHNMSITPAPWRADSSAMAIPQ